MKATSGPLPTGDGWVYEVKWDGMRVLTEVGPDGVRAWSSRGLDAAVSFPELAALAPALAPVEATFDGEVVALDGEGRPSFERLQRRMHVSSPTEAARRAAEVPVAYVVFDLLALAGHDLTGRPWHERRHLLDQLADDLPPGVDVATVYEDGADLLEAARRNGLEGVVAKRREVPYVPGARTRSWVKVKVRLHDEMVVGRLERRHRQPGGEAGVAAVRVPRRARRAAALRGSGGVGVHVGGAGPRRGASWRRWPPTCARSTRRPRRCTARAPTGWRPRWWWRSSTPSGRRRGACATPSIWANAPTRRRRTWCVPDRPQSGCVDSIRLTVPATSAAVRITRAGAAGLATRAGFTYREVEQLRLAVGEAAALLAPDPEGEGTLDVTYDVDDGGLRVELALTGPPQGERPGQVPDVAAAVLDASVDEWRVTDGGRCLVLVKRLTDTEDDDD